MLASDNEKIVNYLHTEVLVAKILQKSSTHTYISRCKDQILLRWL